MGKSKLDINFKPTWLCKSLSENTKESHTEKPGLLEAVPNMPYNMMKDLISESLTEHDMKTIKNLLKAGKNNKVLNIANLHHSSFYKSSFIVNVKQKRFN